MNPIEEYYKLWSLFVRDYDDLLVTCLGAYKIETRLKKTITTSSLTPFEDLRAYIERGWDVCVIPSVIVDKEKGVLKALDIDTPMVSKSIDEDAMAYEESRRINYGRIYYKIPNYGRIF